MNGKMNGQCLNDPVTKVWLDLLYKTQEPFFLSYSLDCDATRSADAHNRQAIISLVVQGVVSGMLFDEIIANAPNVLLSHDGASPYADPLHDDLVVFMRFLYLNMTGTHTTFEEGFTQLLRSYYTDYFVQRLPHTETRVSAAKKLVDGLLAYITGESEYAFAMDFIRSIDENSEAICEYIEHIRNVFQSFTIEGSLE